MAGNELLAKLNIYPSVGDKMLPLIPTKFYSKLTRAVNLYFRGLNGFFCQLK